MVGSLVKVILDTSIYIPFINKGIIHPTVELEHTTNIYYMSVVVIEELYAGVLDKKSANIIDRLFKTFKDLGRLVVPEASDWQKTGKVVAKLGQKYGYEKTFLSRITNDVLIALSVKRIGAVVVTHNIKDFLRIKEFVNFKIYE